MQPQTWAWHSLNPSITSNGNNGNK
jgi:hypothetical protein